MYPVCTQSRLTPAAPDVAASLARRLPERVSCHVGPTDRSKSTMNAGRVFASHYQFIVCDDPTRPIPADVDWSDEARKRGFVGSAQKLFVATEADSNDHWVELTLASQPPDLTSWQRITAAPLRVATGAVHVLSVIDTEPRLTLNVPPGDYTVYIAGQNIGVDRSALGEEGEISDEQLRLRRDLEWYRLFIVPATYLAGRVKDA